MSIDLFKPIVPKEKLCKNFLTLMNGSLNEPTRMMMNKAYEFFNDIDGNFIEQFQTTGFDARTFELYLSSYFLEAQYKIYREYDRPDFIIEKNGLKVAVEATTVNPTVSSKQTENKNHNQEYSQEEWLDKLRNELPIKFGSPLFSKLKKKYWDLEHCKDIPIVLAIEAFHEDESLSYTSNSLIQYLYGQRHELGIDATGNEFVVKSTIEGHKYGTKEIPSVFFQQPDTEFISAIIFSNSGTTAKFKRMGYYYGCTSNFIKLFRQGTCYDHSPEALKPQQFQYDLDDRLDEDWGEGLEVFHNPNAKYPLPKDFFRDAGYHYLEDGEVLTFLPDFHPYYSKTYTVEFDNSDLHLPNGIKQVTKSVVNELIPNRVELPKRPEKCWLLKEQHIKIIVMDEIETEFHAFVYTYEGEHFNIVKLSSFKLFNDAIEFLSKNL